MSGIFSVQLISRRAGEAEPWWLAGGCLHTGRAHPLHALCHHIPLSDVNIQTELALLPPQTLRHCCMQRYLPVDLSFALAPKSIF